MSVADFFFFTRQRKKYQGVKVDQPSTQQTEKGTPGQLHKGNSPAWAATFKMAFLLTLAVAFTALSSRVPGYFSKFP